MKQLKLSRKFLVALSSTLVLGSYSVQTVKGQTTQTIAEDEFDYYQSDVDEIDALLEEDIEKAKEKSEASLASIINFRLFGEEQEGTLFENLTAEGKKVTDDNIIAILDGYSLIEPSLKENVEKLKEIVLTTKDKTLSNIESYVGEENWQAVKEIKDTIKSDVKQTATKVKDKTASKLEDYLGTENYDALGNIKDKIANDVKEKSKSVTNKVKSKASDWIQQQRSK